MAIVVRKTKKGIRYQVKVRDSAGKWMKAFSQESRKDAVLEEARLLGLKKKQIPMSQDARVTTVDEFHETWSVENRADVSKGWQMSQDQMYRDYVKPVIGRTFMADVGAPEVGQCLNRVKQLGRSDQTRKHVYTLLRTLFGSAVEYYEMLPKSPVNAKFHCPKVLKVKRNFLHPKEAFQLLAEARDHYLGPAIWLQTLAALRPSEVQALRGESVLLELDQILVRAAFNKKMRELQDYPKQGDWSYVPMIPGLKRYLRGFDLSTGQFVACGPKGGMLSYETYNSGLKRLCRKAGVPVMTPHELRHSCTEIWIEAGASQMDIQRLLCHASAATTLTYIHRTDDRLSAIGDRIMFPEDVLPGNNLTESKQKGGLSQLH